MRKTWVYLTAWFVAGVAAVGLASAGVAVVGRQVTDSSRQAPFSAEQVRAELAEAEATTTTSTPEVAAPTTTLAPTVTTGPTPPSNDGPTGPTPGGPTVTAPTPTTTPPPAVPAPSTRTYSLVGGTATLRFSATGVAVLSAAPKPGFSVDVGAGHNGGARVEFESDDHRSRVDGWWAGGPQDEVREDD